MTVQLDGSVHSVLLRSLVASETLPCERRFTEKTVKTLVNRSLLNYIRLYEEMVEDLIDLNETELKKSRIVCSFDMYLIIFFVQS